MWCLFLPTSQLELPLFEEASMRTLALALAAVTILALTAVTGLTAGGVLVGSTEPGPPADPVQKHRISSGGLGAIGQGGFLRGGDYRLAKSDMSGTGGGGGMGKGGMMGDMMGGMGKKK
jgi:hypothetical protein